MLYIIFLNVTFSLGTVSSVQFNKCFHKLKVLYRVFTTHREVHRGGTKYDAVLLVDGNLTVSSQVI